MRQLIILVSVLISTFFVLEKLHAQQMITEGSQWNVAWSQYPNSHGTYFYKLEGTTIVNGVTYTVVNQSFDSLLSWNPNGDLLRQDGSKVYVLSPLFNNVEHLLYDFSMQQGDSIHLNPGCSAVVTQIDSVTLDDGIKRKRLTLNTTFPPGGNTMTWIEGVGSYEGLIYDPNSTCGWDASLRTLCFYSNDTLVHLFDPGIGCYLQDNSSVDNREDASTVVDLFPNPVQNELHINFEEINPPVNCSIYSTQGILLQQVMLEQIENTIQLEHLPLGIHLVQLRTSKGNYFYQKIIKQ